MTVQIQALSGILISTVFRSYLRKVNKQYASAINFFNFLANANIQIREVMPEVRSVEKRRKLSFPVENQDQIQTDQKSKKVRKEKSVKILAVVVTPTLRKQKARKQKLEKVLVPILTVVKEVKVMMEPRAINPKKKIFLEMICPSGNKNTPTVVTIVPLLFSYIVRQKGYFHLFPLLVGTFVPPLS